MRGATPVRQQRLASALDFYSHASCEARRGDMKNLGSYFEFLLTRLLRGATIAETPERAFLPDFYSHAPCGARHRALTDDRRLLYISTHTPHARRDCGGTSITLHISQFLLTRPMRGATPVRQQRLASALDFYSHASCEARLRCFQISQR